MKNVSWNCKYMENKYMRDKLSTKEKKILLDLICEEQVKMLVKNHDAYTSDKYIMLEKLKIKIKDM